MTLRVRIPRIVPTAAQQSVFWIKVGGVWKVATPWIKVAGVWKTSTPFIRVGGNWK